MSKSQYLYSKYTSSPKEERRNATLPKMPAWEANYYIKYQMLPRTRNDSNLRSRGLKVIQKVVLPKERSERGRETRRKTEGAPAREAHENRTKNKNKAISFPL